MLINLSGSDSLVVIIGERNKLLQLEVLQVLREKGEYNTQQIQNIDYLIETIKNSLNPL